MGSGRPCVRPVDDDRVRMALTSSAGRRGCVPCERTATKWALSSTPSGCLPTLAHYVGAVEVFKTRQAAAAGEDGAVTGVPLPPAACATLGQIV
jgi:hypothetical protein